MPFEKCPGLPGKIYTPEPNASGSRKHPCRDCFCCQNCSDERCGLCLGPRRSELEAGSGCPESAKPA